MGRSAVRSIAWLDVLNYGERSFLFVAFVNLAVLDDPGAQVPHTDNTRLVVVECKINKRLYRLIADHARAVERHLLIVGWQRGNNQAAAR
jgi:hypothetical protein